MKPRKLLAALFMLGVTTLGIIYLLNKPTADIPQPFDTGIKFPLEH